MALLLLWSSEIAAVQPETTLIVRFQPEQAEALCSVAGLATWWGVRAGIAPTAVRRLVLRPHESASAFRVRETDLRTRFPQRGARIAAAMAPRSTRLPHYCAVTVSAAQQSTVLRRLRQHPAVESVQPNQVYTVDTKITLPPSAGAGTAPPVPAPPTTLDSEVPWGVARTGAPTVWTTTQGAGVIVAVVDSGVDLLHPDLDGRLWTNAGEAAGQPGVDDDTNGIIDDLHGANLAPVSESGAALDTPTGDPTDTGGHGSHVAGTIAANRDHLGVVGMAPQARIMAVRSGDAQHTSLTIAQAVQYAVENGADVINLSLGMPTLWGHDALIAEALQFAASQGVVVVAGAGNDGIDSAFFYPAVDPSVIAVGATTPTDTLTTFSNYGRGLDVVAPGETIYSLDAATHAYLMKSGTSMAAPHVTGAVALLLAAQPTLSPAMVRHALRVAADGTVGTAGWDTSTAYGLMRVDAALERLPYACTVTIDAVARPLLTTDASVAVSVTMTPPAQAWQPVLEVAHRDESSPASWTIDDQVSAGQTQTVSVNIPLTNGTTLVRARVHSTNGLACAEDLVPIVRVDRTQPMRLTGPSSQPTFGRTIAAVGQDLNGDGERDLVIGAPGPMSTDGVMPIPPLPDPTSFGFVSLLSYPWSQHVPGTTKSSGDANVYRLTLQGEFAQDHFGAALAVDADLTGDGVNDLLLGAPAAPCLDGKKGCGAVYLISGAQLPKQAGWIPFKKVSAKVTAMARLAWRGGTDPKDQQLGRVVRWVGDVDGDGRADAAIMTAERAYLLRSSTVTLPPKLQVVSLPDAVAQFQLQSVGEAAELFPVGDRTQDGRQDLLAVTPAQGRSDPSPSWQVVSWMNFAGTELPIPWQLDAGQEYVVVDGGRSAASATGTCDLDGDGVPELLTLSSAGTPDLHWRRLWMPKLFSTQKTPAQRLLSFGPRVTHIPMVLQCAGDVDGDGRDDLAVQWPWYQSPEVGVLGLVIPGRAVLDYPDGMPLYAAARRYHPTAGRPKTTAALFADQLGQSAVAPYTMAPIGDLNNDGAADLAFGIPRVVGGDTPTGEVDLFLGGP